MSPDGKTLYVASLAVNTVTPIATATNAPGTPIKVGSLPRAVGIAP
jgi:YVTN family beta-propeller protein